MPIIQMSSSSFESPIPIAALQGPLRILKRPQNTNLVASSASTPSPKPLPEREAAYQAARDRIFGTKTASNPASSKGNKDKEPSGGTLPARIIRNPIGAPPDPSRDAGFTRRAKKKTNSVASAATLQPAPTNMGVQLQHIGVEGGHEIPTTSGAVMEPSEPDIGSEAMPPPLSHA
jgi:hypothetical protein